MFTVYSADMYFFCSQTSKSALKDTGLVDDSTADLVGGAMDAVENQAEAGRDASVADRLKMAGKTNVDCYYLDILPMNCTHAFRILHPLSYSTSIA